MFAIGWWRALMGVAALSSIAGGLAGATESAQAADAPGTFPFYSSFNSVSANSAVDAWAVGSFNKPGQPAGLPLVEHWNGATWERENAPVVNTESVLHGVDSVSADDAWAVGWSVTSDGHQVALIEHWNGSAWTVSPTQPWPDSFLWNVSASSPRDAWAVGAQTASNGTTTHALVLHWDGTRWTRAVVRNPGGANVTGLAGVVAVSADDVWVTGTYAHRAHTRPLIEHWNGDSWSTSPVEGSGHVSGSLVDATAISPTDIWTVGEQGDGSTLAAHWDGAAWSIVSTPNPPGFSMGLRGVASSSATDVWAVGSAVQGSVHRSVTEYWNGTAWSLVRTPRKPGERGNELSDVVAVSPSHALAVGRYFRAESSSGWVLTLDGSAWH